MQYKRKTGPKVTDVTQIYSAGYKCLSVGAKAIYRARCHELLEKGDLFFSDLQELACYARSCELYWESDKYINEKGKVLSYRDRCCNIRYYANPAVKIARDALNDMMTIGSHFGFTPWSRKKLNIELEQAEDPVDALMKMVANDRSRARKDN